MKKSFFSATIFFILLLMFSAHALDVTYSVVQGDVLLGGTPEYVMTIFNNEDKTVTVSLMSVDLNWLLDQENQEFVIPKNSKKDIQVTFRPLGTIVPGTYGINLFVNTETSRFEKTLPANVVAYDKVISPVFKPAAVVDPRRGAILKLNLVNNYRVKLDNLKLELEGPHFRSSTDVSIEKEETKVVDVPVTLPEDTTEDTYNLHVVLKQDGNTLVDTFLPYKVAAYENVRELVQPDDRFLYGGASVKRSNLGNSESQEFYSKKFSTTAYLLASFSPEPTKIVKENGLYNVFWEFSLAPGDEQTIKYAVNYRTPTLVFILLVIACGAYYVFAKKNAIVVTKRVLAMHGNEGSLHVVKVLLNVRNRGNSTIHNVRVMDKVPSAIKAPTQYGSLRPKFVKSQPGYTAVVWEMPSIPRNHEKIITYVLAGKMQVLGNLTLPPAKAQYALFGRRMLASSSSVSLKGKKDIF